MDLDTLLSFEWSIMAPEFTILIVATILSIADLFMSKKVDRRPFGWIAIAGIIVALAFLVGQLDHGFTEILFDTYRLDGFSKAFKLILLVGTLIVFLLAIPYEKEGKLSVYRGEFYYLLLTALLGAMMMASSADIITLFVGLELLTISSYILAGLKKNSLKSNEAAMKYVVMGGISTAITLFGLSYIYGLTGSTKLVTIAQQLQTISADSQSHALVALAFIITFVGLAFKISSAPFHMWAPDVYEGAPTPVTAFLSVVSKAAGFTLIIRLFVTIFTTTPGLEMNTSIIQSLMIFISVLAGITMIIGNTVALRQRNIKRLFAYSSIAHAGYLLVPLVGFTALTPMIFESTWFYLVAYLFMNLGAFTVIQLMIEKSKSEDLTIFSGLFYRSPLLAIVMTVFLVSLAGIPGTAGFIGKLNIFLGALYGAEPHYVLAGVMMATTVISYFYYFGIMTQMFSRPASSYSKIKIPAPLLIAMIICAAGTLVLGIFPDLAFSIFGDLNAAEVLMGVLG